MKRRLDNTYSYKIFGICYTFNPANIWDVICFSVIYVRCCRKQCISSCILTRFKNIILIKYSYFSFILFFIYYFAFIIFLCYSCKLVISFHQTWNTGCFLQYLDLNFYSKYQSTDKMSNAVALHSSLFIFTFGMNHLNSL